MRTNNRTRIAALALASGLVLAACSNDVEEPAVPVEPAPVEPAEPAEPVEEATEEEVDLGTIVDIAVATEGFSTLVDAVVAAGLADALSGEGPFTVFAPTDDAFAALPDGILAALLEPENLDVLVSILTYHVVSGTVLAADVTDGEVATLEGSTIELATTDGVTVNGASVIVADVLASNGVIHVIDAVILPPDLDLDAL